jgi:putative transposase
MVEDGQHLLNCLRYVDLNMVRAGVVKHPAEWRWCAYDELLGWRKRYRIVNVERLMESVAVDRIEDLQRLRREGVDRQIEARMLSRQSHWTDSLAVGSKAFVEQAQSAYTGRRWQFSKQSLNGENADAVWVVREASAAYVADRRPEMGL